MRETSDEEQTRIGRLQQKRHELPRRDVRASHVGVVGFVEALAQRDVARNKFQIKGGSCDRSALATSTSRPWRNLDTGIVDEDVNVTPACLDLL